MLLKNGTEVSYGEGRVEICHLNEYVAVCDDYWNVQDAQVVCRQLNFSGPGNSMHVLCPDQAVIYNVVL